MLISITVLVRLNMSFIFSLYVPSKEKAPLETAARPADDTEDAAAPKKKKTKALGGFFSVTVGEAAGPALQQDKAIALELQCISTGDSGCRGGPTGVVKGILELYPRLSNLARKYLSMPSIPLQRGFSAQVEILSAACAHL